ncbi:CUB domain-containing protein [Maribacter aquivivus]|uniref:CUB domain-containing protein n=1 Tax=Maribacter aquivivus TaxID=228958 RepID=A0A1M6VWC0_9FLAO|nr:Calx-beta domain-containing protein [Maribacter aquivivus]SHK85665.1 CUB domain-containing protein [Maribacter aquivivus]
MRLRLFCYLLVLLCATSFYAQETYLDTFTSTFYGNNEGTQNFSSDWFESGDDGNAWGGRIQITGGRLRFRNLDNRYIYRFVPLAGASSATLTLDYDANSAGGEAIDVYIYNADNNQWNFVERIDGGTGTLTYNLTNAQIDSNPAVIFYRGDTNWGNNDTIYIDNVQFSATFGSEILVDDVTVNENAGTATFTVRHGGSAASGPYSVNYTTSNISAIAGQDYTASSGTLNFDGTIWDTETITVFITDDTIFEGDETFSFSFVSTTDPNIDITDTAIGTILANDALIITDGGSATTCDDIFLDSGGISNYSDNEDLVYTICPDTANNYTQVNFDQFDVIPGDILYVYDGNSTGATLIGQYDNDNIPTQIFATNTNGCLTFRFTSNNNTTGNGWQASVSCSPPGPKIVVNDVYVDEDSGSAIFTVTHVRDRHGYSWLFGFIETPFTVEYMVSDGTANNGSDYISVNGTLTFTGEVGNVQTFSVPIVDDGVPELVEYFTVGFSDATAQYASVDYSDTANGYINSQILANDPLTLFQEFDGYYDYSTTGGSLRTNDNNTDACSITTSSSNSLIAPIPNTGTIKKAYLYWAHSSTVVDGAVTFEGQTVNANYQYQTTLTNRNFYGYVSDVTDIVAGVADPSTNVFDFSGLSIDNSNTYCSSATVLGGWTLFVFYEDPNLPAVNINLYQGFDGLSNDGNSFTLDSFYAIAGAGAKASFLSWEGDSTLDGNSSGTTNPNGERLSITNQANQDFILSGDGGQTGNNAYNSTMYDNTTTPDYNVNTTYGVDLDTYDISTYISPGDSQVTANVDVGQDFLISAAVVLKVPSNLIAGTVFEDVNYGGGQGRNMTNANGVGIASAIVELYKSDGTFVRRTTSKVSGDYSFGGMADGDYYVKLVNSTVRSNRDNGINCTTCVPIQTFRSYGDVTNTIEVLTEIGGTDPTAFSDSALGVFDDSQSLSLVSIASSGVANIDFGFNFNTIVNTNEFGQGSLEQFILNSNTLGETGLDIEANSIFDPAVEEDVSIFMIPPTGDSFGRTADVNYNAAGYFNILIDDSNELSTITGTNTIIDGRTQAAYSGDANSGTVGAGGTSVGVSNIALPNYERPEIQVHRDKGDVFISEGNNVTIRNLSVFADKNSAIVAEQGSLNVVQNLIGVDATANNSGDLKVGVENKGADINVDGNYLSTITESAILIDGGNSSIIQNNHFINNGSTACDDAILLADGSGVIIRQNYIEASASTAIDGEDKVDSIIITENSLTTSGQDGGDCKGNPQQMAVKLAGNGSSVTNNKIYQNGGAGIAIVDGSSNLISQNSIYANGTVTPSLGIDLDMDGITLNDTSDSDSGPNNLENFPVINSAFISGTNLVVTGWTSPGSTVEVFFTDINEGTATLGDNQLGLTQDYGEGQIFIGTAVEGSSDDQDATSSLYLDDDGNTDNTNKYKFVFPLPSSTAVGDLITTTGTRSNSTSEFSPEVVIKTYTVITNRNITYRIKSN